MKDLGVLKYFLESRVVRYLKGTPGQGILLRADSDLSLQGWCDSDWAASEYRAMAACELKWLKGCFELGVHHPKTIKLFCDSQPFIWPKSRFHERTKHIEDFKAFRNVPNPPCEIFAICLPKAISSSFQLQMIHGLKRWILDFLRFPMVYSMQNWTSGSASKVRKKTAAVFFTLFSSLFSSSPMLVLVFPLEIQAYKRTKSLLNSPK
ncbi:hypothetical protein AAG906_027377 [Vitis piasezkii]